MKQLAEHEQVMTHEDTPSLTLPPLSATPRSSTGLLGYPTPFTFPAQSKSIKNTPPPETVRLGVRRSPKTGSASCSFWIAFSVFSRTTFGKANALSAVSPSTFSVTTVSTGQVYNPQVVALPQARLPVSLILPSPPSRPRVRTNEDYHPRGGKIDSNTFRRRTRMCRQRCKNTRKSQSLCSHLRRLESSLEFRGGEEPGESGNGSQARLVPTQSSCYSDAQSQPGARFASQGDRE